MSRDVETLSAHRAEQSGDGADWTPVDALQACLDDLTEEGIEPDGMLLVLYSERDDGSGAILHYMAGISAPEGVWLAKIAGDRIAHGR